MRIKKLYYFLYYYIYRSVQKSGDNTPAISSALVFATLQSFNILVLLMICENLLDVKILAGLRIEIVVGFSILLMILNSVIAINKKWTEPILNKLENKSEEHHRKNWHKTLAYMLASFLLVLIVPILI